MKRLIYILTVFAAILFAANIQAQEITLRSGQSYGSYSTATAVSGVTANNMDVFVGKDYLYYYDVQWAADSAGDGTNFSLQLKGSNDASNYYNIGSAVIWYVTSTDTILRWNNLASETWVVASHTRTTAAKSDYHDLDYPARNLYHDYDSATGVATTWVDTVSVAAYILTDTASIGAAVETVAAQTYTVTNAKVPWRYLRVTATGAGANAACSITSFTVAILRED